LTSAAAHEVTRWAWVVNRWIGALFAVGSACFAVGSLPPYANAVGPISDAVTFFVGSVFFTTAAALQYMQSVALPASAKGQAAPREWIQTRSLVWWATSVQLIGTLFFNVNTFRGLRQALGRTISPGVVWRPDALGSICFLAASTAALIVVDHRPGRNRLIAIVNLVGSVAFGVSAAAAYVTPSGSSLDADLSAAMTVAGAVCFLYGGLALILPGIGFVRRPKA